MANIRSILHLKQHFNSNEHILQGEKERKKTKHVRVLLQHDNGNK